MAQLVEHILGKDEVISSILITSSRNALAKASAFLFFAFFDITANFHSLPLADSHLTVAAVG